MNNKNSGKMNAAGGQGKDDYSFRLKNRESNPYSKTSPSLSTASMVKSTTRMGVPFSICSMGGVKTRQTVPTSPFLGNLMQAEPQ